MRKLKLIFKTKEKVLFQGLTLLLLLYLLPSCYSFRITNQNGVGEPNIFNTEEGYYKHLMVHEIDTVVKLGPADQIPMLIEEGCETSGFHTVEVKQTLGGILLNTFTLGKKKRIKLKYVCLKPQNTDKPWLELK